MAVSEETIATRTSMPDVVVRHNISDEELEMLCEGRKDLVLEFLWIAIGIFLGSLPSAISAMFTYAVSTDNTKMPVDDLIQIILFWVGLISSIILIIVATKRGRRAVKLQTQIRDRSNPTEN